MNAAEYNWTLVLRDIKDKAFLTQEDMAEKFGVSQQSISNWQKGLRKPRSSKLDVMLNLAREHKIDISDYVPDSKRDAILDYIEKNRSDEIARILELYLMMPASTRKKFIQKMESLASGH